MARRVTLPAADDLFRPTGPNAAPAAAPAPAPAPEPRRAVHAVPAQDEEPAPGPEERATSRRASGRVKHDEKMTVYVTSDELLDLERTRLELRAAHGLGVDRGRLVREAIDLVLADFHARGAESMLVRSLLEE
jgi:hypothetical protein